MDGLTGLMFAAIAWLAIHRLDSRLARIERGEKASAYPGGSPAESRTYQLIAWMAFGIFMLDVSFAIYQRLSTLREILSR